MRWRDPRDDVSPCRRGGSRHGDIAVIRRSPRVWLTTLGCAKNQVDGDKLQATVAAAGYRQAEGPGDADVVMVNTCAFIEEARRESVDTILDAAAAKREDARLVVLGCMAQRYQTELAASLPEADAVIGLDEYTQLIDRLDEMTSWHPARLRRSSMDILYQVQRPAPDTPYAYVKVAEGCDKPCTFCAIPLFRGGQRSRPPANIRREVGHLAASGVSEVVLVAQDLAAYGHDLDAAGSIVDLLRLVADVPGLMSLRLLYLYPVEVRPPLIAEMASNPVVAPYFDLSLQHSVGRLLRAMRRPGGVERHLSLIDSIRAEAPAAALRSSFILGFPGEIDDDVEELAEFLATAQLDWAGFFAFSPEEGTAAAELEGRLPAEEVAARRRYLQRIQADITAGRNAAQVGTRVQVLVDQIEDGIPTGRSYRQAPEIDGVILLDTGRPGQWVTAEMTGSHETDLEGRVV